jgi:hypothetical protein
LLAACSLPLLLLLLLNEILSLSAAFMNGHFCERVCGARWIRDVCAVDGSHAVAANCVLSIEGSSLSLFLSRSLARSLLPLIAPQASLEYANAALGAGQTRCSFPFFLALNLLKWLANRKMTMIIIDKRHVLPSDALLSARWALSMLARLPTCIARWFMKMLPPPLPECENVKISEKFIKICRSLECTLTPADACKRARESSPFYDATLRSLRDKVKSKVYRPFFCLCCHVDRICSWKKKWGNEKMHARSYERRIKTSNRVHIHLTIFFYYFIYSFSSLSVFWFSLLVINI